MERVSRDLEKGPLFQGVSQCAWALLGTCSLQTFGNVTSQTQSNVNLIYFYSQNGTDEEAGITLYVLELCMDVEEMTPLFAVACFYFETVKMYPEKARLGLFHDCGVHWLVEGQQQACSSAPGGDAAWYVSWAVGQSQCTAGSSAMTQAGEWESWLWHAAGYFLPHCLILLTAVRSRESCTLTFSSAILDIAYC